MLNENAWEEIPLLLEPLPVWLLLELALACLNAGLWASSPVNEPNRLAERLERQRYWLRLCETIQDEIRAKQGAQ
jgi:hypothetical protein